MGKKCVPQQLVFRLRRKGFAIHIHRGDAEVIDTIDDVKTKLKMGRALCTTPEARTYVYRSE